MADNKVKKAHELDNLEPLNLLQIVLEFWIAEARKSFDETKNATPAQDKAALQLIRGSNGCLESSLVNAAAAMLGVAPVDVFKAMLETAKRGGQLPKFRGVPLAPRKSPTKKIKG